MIPIIFVASPSEDQKRPFRRRLCKEKRNQLHKVGPFSSITSSETLYQYLLENPNSYNQKVLTLLYRQQETTNSYDEIHHIIPRSAGGLEKHMREKLAMLLKLQKEIRSILKFFNMHLFFLFLKTIL